MALLMHTKLKELPVAGYIGVADMKDIIASICGVTPEGISKVKAKLNKYSNTQIKKELAPLESYSSIIEASVGCVEYQDIVKSLGGRGAAWKRKGSFLVLSFPLYWGGPREPIHLIIRTEQLQYKLYSVSRFVPTD